MAKPSFFLGGVIDPKTGKRGDELVHYDADHLVTHGVIVGMTGSGKTGLGMIYLEEALRNGIPALILDPKGDMTNLLLTFPDLAPEDFEPWVDTTVAGDGKDAATLAAETAESWRAGLAEWGLTGKDIAALRSRVGMTVYTPGSTAGVPLDVLGSLSAPKTKGGTDAEAMRDEIEGLASGMLALVGVESDPLSGREHILLSNIIEQAWVANDDLTLEHLIARVHRPPMRKLGVFEMDTFFPEKDRLALAMRLNTLLASPSFQAWRSGPPLDPATLLWDVKGKPQAAVLYLAHLSDDERQFVVTMVLSRLITWMRSQPGTGDLRVLVYMDEVFGFVPPTAMPPAKKPILTLLKQARAFGVGMLLATQNPVDLDYKAMSNAGTWCIGRLQTERDKARILEALQSASGATDLKMIDALVSGLGKRQFVLHDTRESKPIVFTTRWAMSYLRGPLTRDQVGDLVGDDDRRNERPTASTSESADVDATPVAPKTAGSVPARHIDPAAPWLVTVGAKPSSKKFAAALAVRVRLTFDDAAAGISHREEWEAVFHPLGHPFDPASGIAVDHDPRDFLDGVPDGATYVLPDAPVDTKSWFGEVEAGLRDHLASRRSITVHRNRALKLFSRVGEDEASFLTRCRTAADAAADADLVAVKRTFQTRLDRARAAIEAAYLDVQEAQLDAETRRQEEMVTGAGTILGVLMGRRNSRSLSGAASKRSMTRRAEQRVYSAETKAAAKVESLESLESDLTDAVTEVTSQWQDRAEAIDALEIGLEKTDITVETPVLIWIPV
jgi:hypothetical protein